MDSRQYQLSQQVFLEICDLPPGERTRQLDRACGNDAAVVAAVRAMLAADQQQCAIELGDAERAQLLELLDPQPPADDPPQLPQTIGPYHVLRRIGQGGMGSVFEAQQEQPRRIVAVKVLRRGDNSPAMLRRFRREIELLGRLQHPGIAQIYGAGFDTSTTGSAPYFAMEFVRGEPLTQFATDHSLSIEQKLGLMARICDAVHFAHQKGVLHRDLKPANILVACNEVLPAPSDGPIIVDPFTVKILDFGIARALDQNEHDRSLATDAGQIIGTVGYMSPEQLQGNSTTTDIRTDVYSLGAVMFELLGGRLPHDVRSRSLAQAARMIAFDPPTRLGSLDPRLKGDIEAIVVRALESDPAARYPSASELASDIRRYLAREPVTARPLTAFYQLSRFTQRNRGLVLAFAAAAVALLLGITGTSIGLYRSLRAQHQAIESEARARRESYCVALAAADAISDSDPVRASQLLNAAPPELRGWEWNHYRNRLDHLVVAYRSDNSSASIAIHPEHGPIAALVRDGTLVILDMVNGITLSTCKAQGTLSQPILARRGSILAAIRTDPTGQRTLIAFDTLRGTAIAEFPSGASTWGLSPEGRYLAIEAPEHALEVSDLASKQVVLSRPPVPSQERRMISLQQVGFIAIDTVGPGGSTKELIKLGSRDGDALLSGSHVSAAVLDVGESLFIPDPRHSLDRRVVEVVTRKQGARVSLLQGHSGLISAAVLSADESLVATAAGDHTIRIWDALTGRCRRVISVDFNAQTLRFTADAAVLACSDDQGRALLLTLEDSCVQVLRGHRSFVYHAAFSPDGSLIASASWDDGVRVWDAATGALVATLNRPVSTIYPPVLMGFSRDGASLFTIEQSDVVGAWDLQSFLKGGAIQDASSTSARAIAENPWKFAAASSRWSRLQGGQVRAVSIPGHRVARGEGDGQVHVTDSNGVPIATIAAASSEITALAISPDESVLATCGGDAIIRLWSLSTGSPIGTLTRHTSCIYSLDFSPDGSRLSSAGNDNIVILWDTKSWNPLAELRGHTQYVSAVSFSPDGSRIVSASGDGTVRIWNSHLPARRHAPASSAVAIPQRGHE